MVEQAGEIWGKALEYAEESAANEDDIVYAQDFLLWLEEAAYTRLAISSDAETQSAYCELLRAACALRPPVCDVCEGIGEWVERDWSPVFGTHFLECSCDACRGRGVLEPIEVRWSDEASHAVAAE